MKRLLPLTSCLTLLLALSSCSIFRLYVVPATPSYFRLSGSQDVEYLVRVTQLNATLTVDLEIVNHGNADLMLGPNEFEVRNDKGVVLSRVASHRLRCDGDATLEQLAFAPRAACRVEGVFLIAGDMGRLTLNHFGILRNGKPERFSIPLKLDD